MFKKRCHTSGPVIGLFFITLLLLAACDSSPQEVPTRAQEGETAVAEAVADTSATETAVPVTAQFTPLPPPTLPPPATATSLPTDTSVPPTATTAASATATEEPSPTATETLAPTATSPPPTNTAEVVAPTSPPPQPTQPPPQPTVSDNPVLGPNILPNGSFEEGWYNQNGVPELQLPNHWIFEWDVGPTGFGGQAWDVYVRPETRVLPSAFLPANEHSIFIFDGNQTVKIFKGSGAISCRLLTDVPLEPGSYRLSIKVYPDLYNDFVDGQKIWADDPHSGEVRLIAAGRATNWLLPTFGQRNTFTFDFTIDAPQTVRVGAHIRGRYALANNGFFVDDWSLRKIGG